MRYAYYPGCSAKGTCPELHKSVLKLASVLDIELVELDSASCCGAGVIAEKDPDLADVLNIRTFAQAEKMGLDILTVCGTCQGVLGSLNKKLKEDEHFWERTQKNLDKVSIVYNRSVEVRHIMWILNDEENLEKISKKLVNPLRGLRVAPFYGCHILRPSQYLGVDNPERPASLEKIITALGATAVDYTGKVKCCGFPLVLEKENIALGMIGKNLNEAKKNGADCIVTPCPLCHMNLDIYQEKAEEYVDESLRLPILHFSQLVAMALGITSWDIQNSRHMVSTSKIEKWLVGAG